MRLSPAQFSPQHHALLMLLEEAARQSRAVGAVLLPRHRLRVGRLGDPRGLAVTLADGTRLDSYDDWACLADFEAARWIRVISRVHGLVELTPVGQALVAAVHQARATGAPVAPIIHRFASSS